MDSQLDMQPIEADIAEQERKRKHRRKQNIISIVVLIVGLILILAFLGYQKSKNTVQPTVPKEIPAIVKTIILDKNSQAVAELSKSGVLKSTESAEAIAEYSGRIKEINFEVGDQIERGQILVVFDQSDLANSPKIGYQSAQNSYNLTQNNLSNVKKITEESIELAKDAVDIAELQYDQAKDGTDKTAEKIAKENLSIAKEQEDQARYSAKNQINAAEIQLNQAQALLDESQIKYEKTFVKAPIAGIITAKGINNEDYINAGQTIAEISGKGNLESSLYLNSDEIGRITVGDSASIIIGAQKYAGRIASFSPVANGMNRRFEVVVEALDNISDRANETATIVFNLKLESGNENSFFIPLEAVNIGQQKKEIFIVKDGKAMSVEVETGKIVGQDIEITKGLSVGDNVVIENNRGLRDGQELKVAGN